jgi:uncharacterized protein YcbX
MAWVTRIAVAPVKGLALVHPDEVDLGRDGVAENRRFCLVDEEGRRYGLLRDGRLQTIVPDYDAANDRLALRFPDGSVAEGTVELGDARETDLFRKRLPVRAVEGPWSRALSDFLGRTVTLVHAGGPTGSLDRGRHGAVTLVSEASLEELARRAGTNGAVDGRRFRMLFQVDGVAPHEEDVWLARDVVVGGAVVHFSEQVARCAITTQDPATGRVDLDTLRVIKDYRGFREGSAKHLDFGVFGHVVEPGRVRVGDAVEPL